MCTILDIHRIELFIVDDDDDDDDEANKMIVYDLFPFNLDVESQIFLTMATRVGLRKISRTPFVAKYGEDWIENVLDVKFG